MLNMFVNTPDNSLEIIPAKLLIAIKNAYAVPSKFFGHNFAAMIAKGKNDICPINAPIKQFPITIIFVSISILSVMNRFRDTIRSSAMTLVHRMTCTTLFVLRYASKKSDPRMSVTYDTMSATANIDDSK